MKSLFLATALLFVTSILAQDIPLTPYIVDHHARQDSAADVRFLLDAPAGKYGFVVAHDGHLFLPNGQRFRCWGVNDAGWTEGSALLPPHKDAEIMANELARIGANCVRFQFLDLLDRHQTRQGAFANRPRSGPIQHSPAGLIDADRDDTRVLDKDQLDKLDYLIYQLKINGIYVDLNLNVGRVYKKGDGVEGYNLIGVAKAITYFDPKLIELEKEYARELLTHHNPYTNTDYAHEPAVMIVEILNENSVLEFWQRNWFRGDLKPDAPRYQLDLTPYHKKLLTDLYNKWLAKNRTAAQIAALRKEAGVAAGQPVPLLMRQDFDEAPKDRFYTEATFYTDLESGFLTMMDDYLKKDLGVKSLIIGTADHTYFIPGMPLVRSLAKLDIVDSHVYWQTFGFSGLRDTPMVNDPLHSIVVKLTRSAMEDKPHTVSEVNDPFPSDYESEFIPILAAYGAFQDWDGIFVYAYESKLEGQWQPVIGDHFDISEDPVKIAQMPAGALIFLRHDVGTARKTIARTYSMQQINESMRLPSSELPYFTPGFPLSIPLEHRSVIECLDCQPTQKFTDVPSNPIVSDTKQLSWHVSDKTKHGLVSIDTDRSTALVGFVKEAGVETSHLSAEISNDFCAITLSSMDGKPISHSELLLLTTTGRVENTGQVWNERRTDSKVWGTAPTRIETIKGYILLKDIEGAVGMDVTALDGAAKPINVAHGREIEQGWEFPVGDVATTTYLIKVIR